MVFLDQAKAKLREGKSRAMAKQNKDVVPYRLCARLLAMRQ